MTTYFLKDILRQPAELQRTLDLFSGGGRPKLEEAASAIHAARHVFITGIGASWHAAMNVAALFELGGRPIYLRDASELLHFAKIPSGSTIIILSRSGRSIEIVRLLEKARNSGATVVGITNAPEGSLARESHTAIVTPVERDHGISVNTYSTLGLSAGLVAAATLGNLDSALIKSLSHAMQKSADMIQPWRKQIENSKWFEPAAPYYFLARGSSLGTCHEARLLWEEGVKLPASAMSMGNFRHGPQEIVTQGLRVGMWIDSSFMREEDLAVARDLQRLGASVMLIGQRIPQNAADLVFQISETPDHWQFVMDAIPVQLAAEYLSRLSGVDCDSFRVCSYVVEGESGLLAPDQPLPKNRK